MRSTAQTGLNRTVPLTPEPGRVTLIVDIDVDGGTVLTTTTDVVGRTVDRTVPTDDAGVVGAGVGRLREVVACGVIAAAVTGVVVVASLATLAWVPHAVPARQIPMSTIRIVRPQA